MTEPVYQIRELTKSYNNRQVLRISYLDILPGEVFALVGPSGAGKSTLLRLLNFLEEPTSGSLAFLGKHFQSGGEMSLELRRRVTTVFQRPMLLNRSVWDNVSFGLRLRGKRNGKQVIRETLEQVGLEDLAGQRARTLSGGEAQRVALARAMVLQPDVLLLDEPTANLDPYNVGLIEQIVRDLNRYKKTTIVLVTHNIFQAKRLADRIGFVLGGEMIEVAEASMFFENAQDARTAAFVRGDMIY